MEECTKVLNSFPLNKVPGNDGLLVEFYKIFWDSIAQILVECFNESFTKGEMSSSQRQGVCPGVRVNEGIAIVVSLFRSHCYISFLL